MAWNKHACGVDRQDGAAGGDKQRHWDLSVAGGGRDKNGVVIGAHLQPAGVHLNLNKHRRVQRGRAAGAGVTLVIQELLPTTEAVKLSVPAPVFDTASSSMRLPGVAERAAKFKMDGATVSCCGMFATLSVTATSLAIP